MKKLIVFSMAIATMTQAGASVFSEKLKASVQAYREAFESENGLSCNSLQSRGSIKFRCVNLSDIRFGVTVDATVSRGTLEMDTEPFYPSDVKSIEQSFGKKMDNSAAFHQFTRHLSEEALEKGVCGEPQSEGIRIVNKSWDKIECMGTNGISLGIHRTIKEEMDGNVITGWDSLGAYISTIRVSLDSER